jgi:hypothetical protein
MSCTKVITNDDDDDDDDYDDNNNNNNNNNNKLNYQHKFIAEELRQVHFRLWILFYNETNWAVYKLTEEQI